MNYLAQIHVAKRELRLDDPTYRLVLERVTGKSSAKECTEEECGRVLEEFRSRGWRPKRGKKRPKVLPEVEERLNKVEALLADAGRPWSYGHALARRICKVERLEWVPAGEWYKIITALELDKRRRARDGA